MKTRLNIWVLSGVLTVFLFNVNAQTANDLASPNFSKPKHEISMKTYLIERELPGAGTLSKEELKGISQKSCDVIDEMGSGIQWLHSYVTDDKVYCLYKADDEEKLKLHAEKGGFPITQITSLSTTISPSTAQDEPQNE